mmetsp:Transcript_28018/g.90330  ORF Transcript_28018/g.90330 Transcript_28018/m.90330 type:complete len:115 (+) Transcript_28018:135-479(+)
MRGLGDSKKRKEGRVDEDEIGTGRRVMNDDQVISSRAVGPKVRRRRGGPWEASSSCRLALVEARVRREIVLVEEVRVGSTVGSVRAVRAVVGSVREGGHAMVRSVVVFVEVSAA